MEIRSWLPPWIRPRAERATEQAAEAPAATEREPVPTAADDGQPPAEAAGEDVLHAELRARRDEIVRMEERALRQMESVETQLRELERRREGLADRERNLERERDELKLAKRQHMLELERIAGLSAAQARQVLLKEVEEQAQHQAGLTLRRIEEETKLEAERRARGILAVSMQRLAAAQAGQTTTRLVHLPSDEMKGRIIGRDGRNIRALENLTGVDFIIDETPSAVLLSSFDGVRREVARLTL